MNSARRWYTDKRLIICVAVLVTVGVSTVWFGRHAIQFQWHAYGYRTSDEGGVRKLYHLDALFEPELRKQFIGLSKNDITSLIGEPDDVWGEGSEWWYTGEGHVSDGTPGCALQFDEAGRVAGWNFGS